jgi:hypothetical protein
MSISSKHRVLPLSNLRLWRDVVLVATNDRTCHKVKGTHYLVQYSRPQQNGRQTFFDHFRLSCIHDTSDCLPVLS